MPGKYIFYDLETTGKGKKESANSFGTTPKWEQILQIAAIVVDENFQATNQNLNEFCRPPNFSNTSAWCLTDYKKRY